MLTLLYVDDETTLLDTGKIFLERKGQFSVHTTTSASAALSLMKSTDYDAIISDYQMPGMDGIEFLKQVRGSGNPIPFILFTGRGREEIVIQALNEGADYYLQKGGDPKSQFAELSHQILRAVRQRKAEISIRDHERKEQDIINFLPDATFAIDTHGVVIAWNHAMEQLTGVAASAILGKGDYAYAIPFYHEPCPVLIDLVLKDDPVVPARYSRFVCDGHTLRSEIQIPHLNNGKGAWLWLIASPLYNDRNEVVGAIESIRDITDRKLAQDEIQIKSEELQASFEQLTTTEEELRQNYDELREYEKVLLESEERYRTVFENTGTATVLIEEDAVISIANGQFALMSGYAKEEVEGHMRWTDFVVPEDLERMMAQHRLRRETPGTAQNHYEFRFVARSGAIRTIFLTIGMIPGTKRSVASLLDITERKRAGEEMARIALEWQRTFDATDDGIWILDKDQRVLRSNRTAGRIFQRPCKEFIGKFCWEIVHGTDAPVDGCPCQRARTSLRRETMELQIGDRWFEVTVDPILDAAGGYAGAVHIVSDITGRRLAESALRESEAEFRDFFNHTGDAIVIHDLQGRFLAVNDEICRRLGYTREELLVMMPPDIDEPDYGRKVKDRIATLEQTGQIVFETVHHAKDGTLIPTEVSSRMILYHGEPAILSTGRDITERKRVEDALRKANRQLTMMTSVTRHDIGNQILAILAYLEMVRKKSTDSKTEEYLNKLELATRAIRSQIEFTKVYQDLGSRQPQWLKPETLLQVLDIPAPVTLTSGVNSVEVYADPMLEKVFSNLLDNSLRHGDHVTEIRVSSHPVGKGLTLVWEDNGAGIEADDKDQIFERGYGKNTGLGLFLVREILSLTGMSIRETGEPGHGARFEISVPDGMFRTG